MIDNIANNPNNSCNLDSSNNASSSSGASGESRHLVSVIMGSQSDFAIMQKCLGILQQLKIRYECRIISAHRTPQRLYEYAKNVESCGVNVIIAAAGGAAHLPGMVASLTYVPVIGVPVKSRILNGIDSLLSIVQMPRGIPVGTVAIGEAGAVNAALYAAAIISNFDVAIKHNLKQFRQQQTESIANVPS